MMAQIRMENREGRTFGVGTQRSKEEVGDVIAYAV
jgi:hypothetical protein